MMPPISGIQAMAAATFEGKPVEVDVAFIAGSGPDGGGCRFGSAIVRYRSGRPRRWRYLGIRRRDFPSWNPIRSGSDNVARDGGQLNRRKNGCECQRREKSDRRNSSPSTRD